MPKPNLRQCLFISILNDAIGIFHSFSRDAPKGSAFIDPQSQSNSESVEIGEEGTR